MGSSIDASNACHVSSSRIMGYKHLLYYTHIHVCMYIHVEFHMQAVYREGIGL